MTKKLTKRRFTYAQEFDGNLWSIYQVEDGVRHGMYEEYNHKKRSRRRRFYKDGKKYDITHNNTIRRMDGLTYEKHKRVPFTGIEFFESRGSVKKVFYKEGNEISEEAYCLNEYHFLYGWEDTDEFLYYSKIDLDTLKKYINDTTYHDLIEMYEELKIIENYHLIEAYYDFEGDINYFSKKLSGLKKGFDDFLQKQIDLFGE